MNTLNTFQTQGDNPFIFSGEKPSNEEAGKHQAQTESQWRRVLGVILVDGEMRYLVERGE